MLTVPAGNMAALNAKPKYHMFTAPFREYCELFAPNIKTHVEVVSISLLKCTQASRVDRTVVRENNALASSGRDESYTHPYRG